MASPALAKVGVEAVVSGLSSFQSDLGSMGDSVKAFAKSTNLVEVAFNSLGNVVSGIIGSVFRVLEYTLGNLIAGAIRAVTEQIRELVTATIDAGAEFQTLEIRLRNLNLNALVESGMDYVEAGKQAVDITREQLDWLQKLAATTPYDLTDVARTFTLARSYGFVADEAKDLTGTILDFAAGMGLGNTEINRIITNFGQMVQQGKVTQREMNDLARGAFVPVNDVLKLMQEQTGLTGTAFDDFKTSSEGVNAFMSAFTQLVETRFQGSSEKMAQTWKGATDNLKDFVKSIFGLNVVKPVLDVLGKSVSDFVSSFTSGERWQGMIDAAKRIGDSLSSIVSQLLGLGGSGEEAADRLLGAIKNIASWLEANEDSIVSWVRDQLIPWLEKAWDFLFGKTGQKGAIQKFGDWLMLELLPFLQRQILPALSDLNDMLFGAEGGGVDDLATSISEINNTPLQNLLQIFKDLQPAIEPAMEVLRAFGDVIITAFGGDATKSFGEFVRDTLVPSLKDLALFIDKNREGLALLLQAFLAMQVIVFLVNIVLSIIGAFVKFAAVTGIIATVTAVLNTFVAFFTWMGNTIATILWSLFSKFMDWKNNVTRTFTEVINSIRNNDWVGAGKAVVDGIWRGIQNNWNQIISLVKSLAQNTVNAFKSTLGIRSPSTVFAGIGENIMLGLSQGISEMTGAAAATMQSAAAAVTLPAVQMSQMAMRSMPNTSSTTNNYNYNLQVNTSARAEPIIQDFAMMESLAV